MIDFTAISRSTASSARHGQIILSHGVPPSVDLALGCPLSCGAAPNQDDPADDFLLVELYDFTTGGGLPPLMSGTVELGAPGNDDLATCQQCFWVRVDETPEKLHHRFADPRPWTAVAQ